jgi:hypothetical protein
VLGPSHTPPHPIRAGIAFSVPGPLEQTKDGWGLLLAAVDNGYNPVGFFELFFAIQVTPLPPPHTCMGSVLRRQRCQYRPSQQP